ncbi:MAG TPA: ribosome biogenesis GTPase Der [Planctomycetes bacterium]|nr:ribosome biogenesis GTPase Der [Planctomycetota bacterium]
MNPACIAIVGRPNVGKSSYFNAVIGRRIAIVEPTPGVTRDRVSVPIERGGRIFELVDTGGIGIVDEAMLNEDIEGQIDMALHLADAVVFIVDGKDGPTALDRQVADRLRPLGKPVVLAVNKIDHPNRESAVLEFHALGMGEPIPLSAQEGFGVEAVLERAIEILPDRFRVPETEVEDEDDGLLKLAFVGKRNVGKSTLLNQLAGDDRVIVSDLAGTTRDAVDADIDFHGRRFRAIDTAGIMKKQKVKNSIDFYSQARTEAAIRRADVVLFLFDATLEVSQVDKKIARQLVDAGRPSVLVINKWDLAREGMSTEEYLEYLTSRLPGLHYAPVVFISALEKMNLEGAIDVAFDLHAQAQVRIGTGELNRVLEQAFERRKPGGRDGYKAKVFYGTQVDRTPPTFIIFVNDPSLFPANYQRYIENRLREAFAFEEIPLQVFFRRRQSLYHD